MIVPRPKASLGVALLALLLTACATTGTAPEDCPPDRQALENCPPMGAVNDPGLNEWYRIRTWMDPDDYTGDAMQLGIDADIPIQQTRAKFLGSSSDDAIRSLTTKIHMIENARYSVDAMYYIFTDDLVGLAMLGALCDAVQRGVDVRLMVDSVGSIGLNKRWLRALQSCENDADFIRNPEGSYTTRRARVQVLIFNALTTVLANPNRRSHDKLLVADGFMADRAIVITGGRNISLAYYGINADGSPNHHTYNDAEILLRPAIGDLEDTVGEAGEVYFTLLSLYKDNKFLQASNSSYESERAEMAEALATMKSVERLKPFFEDSAEFLEHGWRDSRVRLAHELGNLVSDKVITGAVDNLEKNPNSIMHLLSRDRDTKASHGRIVSPYLFLARYYDDEGNLLVDEVQSILDWLDEDPRHRFEMITNSVLTSDNVPAQAIVDMDMAPRMMLDEATQAAWISSLDESELNPELVDSETWKRLVNHPQLAIYETGRMDDAYFGGDKHYGKLHAKFLMRDNAGFIGTANFDYRSRLFNNEMGFFFDGPELAADMIADFELLKSQSYLWGSPEWLEMRRKIMEQDGVKPMTVRNQRAVFKTLRKTGLEYYF
jgi:phosphatidylserine/phosphatidylglycerophosphate/cardiolipin synthase-like enzyme